MAYKQPKHNTISDLLQYHLSLYYVERERHKTLIADRAKHILVVQKAEKGYFKTMATHYPDWDTEENRKAFREQIDFLTQIFTQQKREEERTGRFEDMKSKLRKAK